MSRTATTTLNVEQLEDRMVLSTVELTNAGVLKITGSEASETIQLRQGNGVISITGMAGGVKQAAVKSVLIDARGGGDYVDCRTLLVPCTIYGGSGNDYIMGGENADYIDGGNDHDIVFGLGGNDQLFGGYGDDRLLGGNGTNYLTGGYGIDFMDGGTRGYVADQNDGSNDFIANTFAPGNKYSADHVAQGSQSYTCAFLSTVGGMAKAGVNLGAYIKYCGYDNNGVGQYDVSLWNGRQGVAVRVQFDGHTDQTDAQVKTDYASWVTIMNRAWVRFHGNRGASPADVLFALGRSPSIVYQNKMSTATFASIQASLSRGLVVACGTVGAPVTRSLENNHAYQVVQAGVYNGVRWVQLRNPWAHDGGTASDNNPRDGYLWVTWDQFVANISHLVVG